MTQQNKNLTQVTVALVQMACTADKRHNLEKALGRIADAASQGANIVCLQELFHSLYPCQNEDHRQFEEAEPIPGPTSQALADAAKKHNVVVIGSLFERRAAGVYHNTAVVFDNQGQQCGLYRKMHIPDDPLYYEKFYFSPGDLGFQSIETPFGSLGICICWDQWFPEAARLTALAGAQILFYPTAVGWLKEEKESYGESQHDAWQTMMRSHAIANGLFVAAVNRVGIEDQLEFWGASFMADPYGSVIVRASHTAEETLLIDCDLDQIEAARTHWPFFRDRRIDAYGGLTQRYLDEPQ